MIKINFILLSFFLLISSSFQNPLPPAQDDIDGKVLDTGLESMSQHLAPLPSEVILVKRTSPEREMHSHAAEDVVDDHIINYRNHLLQQWDAYDADPSLSDYQKKTRRKEIMNALIGTVPYHPQAKRAYIDAIQGILGNDRVDRHRKQVTRRINDNVPKEDKAAFAALFEQDANKRKNAKRPPRSRADRTRSKSTVTHDVSEDNADPQDWDDYYTLDEAQNLASAFEDLGTMDRNVDSHHQNQEQASGQQMQASHEQQYVGEHGHPNHYYGYLDNYDAQNALHGYPNSTPAYPLHEHTYWPHEASPGSSTAHHDNYYHGGSSSYHNDHHGFDDAEDVASMFQNMSPPSGSYSYPHY